MAQCREPQRALTSAEWKAVALGLEELREALDPASPDPERAWGAIWNLQSYVAPFLRFGDEGVPPPPPDFINELVVETEERIAKNQPEGADEEASQGA